MKKSKFSDSQIMSIIKQSEAGIPVPELCREHGRFCRKKHYERKRDLFWTHLCCESIELFKNSLISRLGMLFFSEHVMQFNAG